MTQVKDYIMSIITVCLLCAGIIHLTKNFKSAAYLIKILCGILMALTIFTPITRLRWNELSGYLDRMESDAQITAAEGYESFCQDRYEGIQARIEAYILDKASCYGCELHVQVELSEEDPPIPVSVLIQGAISPYQKKQLSDLIATELGIPKEMQVWNGAN